MPSLLRFGLFLCIPISRTSIPSPFSPHSSPYLSPLPGPPLPFTEEVNKKLSYRAHNALSIKTHERNAVNEHIYTVSIRTPCSLDWPDA